MDRFRYQRLAARCWKERVKLEPALIIPQLPASWRLRIDKAQKTPPQRGLCVNGRCRARLSSLRLLPATRRQAQQTKAGEQHGIGLGFRDRHYLERNLPHSVVSNVVDIPHRLPISQLES